MEKKIWQFNNPHPKGLMVGDCVKRAITIATGKSYGEVSRELNRLKREIGATKFSSDKVWKRYVKDLGWKKISFPAVAGQPRVRGQEFVSKYPKGTYLLNVKRHLVTVVDGVYQDTFDSSGMMIYNAWEVKQ